MKFSDIPGHESAKERLRAMVDTQHLPHALLISSPEGAGEMMLARAFVQYLHCTDRTPDGDSCGTCPACVQHQTFNHVDTHFVFPVLKKNQAAPPSAMTTCRNGAGSFPMTHGATSSGGRHCSENLTDSHASTWMTPMNCVAN